MRGHGGDLQNSDSAVETIRRTMPAVSDTPSSNGSTPRSISRSTPALTERQASVQGSRDDVSPRDLRYIFKVFSMVAQASATAELASLLPGIVAQPPFVMKVPCCHELTFLSSTKLAAASGLC